MSVPRRLSFGVIAALPGAAISAAVTSPPWVLWGLHSVAFGAVLGLLVGSRRQGLEASLSVGMLLGLLDWVTWQLTVVPLVHGRKPTWTITAAVAEFDDLVGAALKGAIAGILFFALSTSLGAVFTGVMIAVGFLPTVASLIGSESAFIGLIVHLLIAQAIGVTYAIFFRRSSFDPASAPGWGVSYGFLWWVLGNLTLLPLFLGSTPTWTAGQLAASFPSLVGHLAYGGVLGLVCQWLAERVRPSHLTRSQAAAERAEAAREQMLSAAPAMWTVVTVLALLIPVIVA